MKPERSVTVCDESLSADLVRLLEELEPADVPRIDRACRGLSGLHAVLAALLKPQPDRTPIDAAELNDLERHVMALEAKVERQDELLDRMADEIAGLHRLATGQAERIAAQSEMLARRAERAAAEAERDAERAVDSVPQVTREALIDDHTTEILTRSGWLDPDPVPVPVPPAAPVTVIDDPEADLAPPPEPEPVPEPASAPTPCPPPEPSANGHTGPDDLGSSGRRQRRLAVARLLHAGPRRSSEICAACDVPAGTITGLLQHEWFRKDGTSKRAPYAITDAGRAALRDAGYLVPGTVGQMIAKEGPATSRAREHLRLVVEALAGAATPMTADGIAAEAGLPVAAVEKRLERHGPAAINHSQLRYFARSGDLWSLTDAGRALAKEGAVPT